MRKAQRRPSTKVQRVEVGAAFDVTKYSEDFVGFAGLLDILPKDAKLGRVKLRPSAIQSAFEISRSGHDIVLKPRQVGFTTWELARDVWKFVVHRERVVIVCQSSKDDDQLKDLSAKLSMMFESLRAIGLKLPFASESVSEWRLGDASLCIIVAGASEASAQKKGRGGTINRLHITELAFFEYAALTLNALLECVPADGEVTIESTANGAGGEFYERYQAAKKGDSEYRATFFAWVEHEEYALPLEPEETIAPETPRERQLVENHGGTPEQLKWYRRKVRDKKQDLVDQEYPIDEATCWLIAGRLFFDREACVALKAKTTPPIAAEMRGELRIWKQPVAGLDYVVVADPSEGMGGDPGAAGVFERATGEHVATLHGQFPPGLFAERLAQVGRKYNTALIVVERNNHGHTVLYALVRGPQEPPAPLPKDADGNIVEISSSAARTSKAYPRIFVDRDDKLGWLSGAIPRATALDTLENDIRKKVFRTPDERVAGELLTFVVNKKGKAEAASGAHDDLVITMAIARNVLARALPMQRGVVNAPILPFG